VKRSFDYQKSFSKEGISVCVGLVKKVVTADTCATYANVILITPPERRRISPYRLVLYFASLYPYGDSWATYKGIGKSKLFGIGLLRNFNYPIMRYS
jgi:D-alanyl-lipoteichoic acid acyltransferase DltB (MBOAT superfamily)